jgi:hypothetical protein
MSKSPIYRWISPYKPSHLGDPIFMETLI